MECGGPGRGTLKAVGEEPILLEPGEFEVMAGPPSRDEDLLRTRIIVVG